MHVVLQALHRIVEGERAGALDVEQQVHRRVSAFVSGLAFCPINRKSIRR